MVLTTNKVDSIKGSDKLIEKCGKLSKSEKLSRSGKSKSKKISKSRNLAKLGKNLSKSRNLTNFDTIEDRPKFLTFDTRIAFNRL